MDIRLNTKERLELLQLLYQFSTDENDIDIVESLFNKVGFSDEEKHKLKIVEQPGEYRFGFQQEDDFSFDDKEQVFLKSLYELIARNKMFNLRNVSLLRKIK